ncbi:hypothetical protein CGRA01v4_11843 [Colletotrichum graminicola]|uniref:Major facilitator superfamily transporter n=1 Tax=Colletotrichum graminicola (strain M1.001 / M2 / FGSC 10212) TaxID=645133 RepID=E3QC01_COLGM|nr:uncharacterized protein GLRG_03380 [Colletotrichum graminicola M1.001]EFQ28236.1 hypothetical protein GLRG_03380 [Colletotrichum graminicola M1.001]WDK20556.1 hypothetical protein CGRA01v4_11843 [Colletotrichum graminicola]
MMTMLKQQSYRGFIAPRARPKTLLFFAIAIISVYFLATRGAPTGYHVVPWNHEGTVPAPDKAAAPPEPPKSEEERKEEEERQKQERERHEQDLRDEFAREYEAAKQLPGSDAIYGNTLNTLKDRDNRTAEHAANLRESGTQEEAYTNQRPVYFNPYPNYNSAEWNKTHRAPYVPCIGATGEAVEDLLVFKGHPANFPNPGFGGFDILNMDGNICYERETRLGPYGLLPQLSKAGLRVDWDNINWGDLQEKCIEKNAARFDKGKPNEYIKTAYPDIAEKYGNEVKEAGKKTEKRGLGKFGGGSKAATATGPDARTAVLLRTYTGKKYTENDKQVIRSLISELSLRSGGEYQVFLLLHVRDQALDIWNDEATYQYVLNEHVPLEFHGITKLWNDQAVWNVYTALTDDNEKSVHSAQWLSVQKFSQDHPEFDFIWNWEMDARIIGHNYDFLQRLADFAKKQPRRGLWERNERYYIPEFHGDYDTDFRKDVERRTRGNQVWGPPKLPFINPVGPKPPVENPEKDPYKWGVGEDADMITVGPIFNPINSSWIISDHIWGYRDEQFPDPAKTLPRRTTIVTQSRVSKRLLDIMHVENLRGNHIASEMTPQTVALLHGFKTVFAPHPTWFDRPWNGTFLAKWFNPGPRGESGGEGSPMGWGRERRYQGMTWYYRAEPPPRLYNNWMGYVDTKVGGKNWEKAHGRPCLPPMILHPIKEVKPTEPGFATQFELFYG